MGLKAGFKHSEVGAIPFNWHVKRLAEVSHISTGSTPPTRDVENYGDEFLFVSPVDLGANKYIFNTEKKLSKKGFCISRRFPVGSILFTCIGSTIGKCGIAPVELTSNQQINAVLPRDEVNNEFLYYELSFLTPRIKALAGEQAVPIINKTQFGDTAIPIPPLPEQRAIATALSDVDALINSLDRLIAKKRDMKQAAMQELLPGKRRLPGFTVKPGFKQTELGRIPEDWHLSLLVDLVDPARSIRYGIVQPGEYDPRGRYMIRGQDYSEAKGWANQSDVFRVSDEVESRYRNARVQEGDLIMTIVGYCGHVELVPKWLEGANLTQTTARIAIRRDKAVSAFCKYLLQSPIGKTQVAAYLKGAAQPGLNCGDVERFIVLLPSIEEQTAIAAILSDMDAEIMALEQKRDKSMALKQGMMQELLTGRIRLV